MSNSTTQCPVGMKTFDFLTWITIRISMLMNESWRQNF